MRGTRADHRSPQLSQAYRFIPGMRGTLSCSGSHFLGERFIPAHAGNSVKRKARSITPAVHPRACGELTSLRGRMFTHTGSSPRMRGTPTKGGCMSMEWRFIPAHAGNSSVSARCASHMPVHPRACGELRERTRTPDAVCGSSPRMRGTQRDTNHDLSHSRFIPGACGELCVIPS